VVDPGLITGLSCSTAVHSGTLIQGLMASGVSSSISYTGGNSGPYSAQTISSTGVAGLTATLTAGNFVSGNGTISYTVSGTPAGNGTASFAITIGGQICTLTRTVLPIWRPGMVHCGSPTQVVPVTNPATGKTWMDRNLGASGVAVSSTDDNAKGDWYQWGRFGDGHQCRNSGGQYNNPSNTDTPGHSNFILGYSDWRSPQNNNLWQGVNGINNPCPNGYRLPTEAEFLGEINSWTGGRNSNGAFSSWLKFVLGGYRSYSDGSSAYYNQRGYYSTSTTNGNWAIQVVAIYQFSASIETFQSRASGISVRCIKD
jgi:uncharacterized protein (TIGR02145 family)